VAKDKTLAAIQFDVESHGFSMVPFTTLEVLWDISSADDDFFDEQVRKQAGELAWVAEIDFDWINKNVTFNGPVVPL